MLYVGTDSTVWHSADGVLWERGATLPNPGYYVDALFHDGSTLFAGTGGDGLYVSPIDGITWQFFSEGLTGIGSYYIADVMAFDNDLWCATVGGGIFRRSGASWEPFGALHEMNAGNVSMLRVIGDTLWAGAGGNGYVWRTMPGMHQFEAVQVAPVEWDMHAITDIVSLGSTLIAGGTYGVYRSTDGGDTWIWSSTGLPGGANVRFLQTGQALYALRSGGTSRLYRSTDDGLSWEPVEQLTFCYAIAEFQGRLYAGRLDGLWVRDLSTGITDEEKAPDGFDLFPDPATDIVQVRLAFEGRSRIEFIDAGGRSIRTEHFAQGNHVVDVTGFAPGTYVVRVTCSSGRAERRLIIR